MSCTWNVQMALVELVSNRNRYFLYMSCHAQNLHFKDNKRLDLCSFITCITKESCLGQSQTNKIKLKHRHRMRNATGYKHIFSFYSCLAPLLICWVASLCIPLSLRFPINIPGVSFHCCEAVDSLTRISPVTLAIQVKY